MERPNHRLHLDTHLKFLFASVFGALVLGIIFLMVQPNATSPVEKIIPNVWYEPLATTDFSTKGFIVLADQLPDFSQATWQKKELPLTQELPEFSSLGEKPPMTRLWLSYDISAKDALDLTKGIAIYGTRMMGGSYAIYINNKLAFENHGDWHMQWNHPLYFFIPQMLLNTNTATNIKIALPYRNALGYAAGSLYIGDAGQLKRWSDVRYFFSISFPWFCSSLILILGIMSLHLYFAKIDASTNWLFLSTASAYFVCNLQFIFDVTDDTASLWYGAFVDSSTSWFIALSSVYITRFSKAAPWPWVERFAYTTALLISIATLPLWGSNNKGLLLQHSLNTLMVISIALFLVYLTYKERNVTLGLLSVSLWLLIAGGNYDLQHITNQSAPDGYYTFNFVALPFMFCFIYVMQRNYVRTYKQTLAESEIRKQELDQQRIELLESQKIIVEQAHQLAVSTERNRFMLDIHDGVGGLLIHALQATQDREELEDVYLMIKDAMEDLECVILSLSPTQLDLTTLIGSFKEKFGRYNFDAIANLHWEIDDLPNIPHLDPPSTLGILRIILEAIRNSLNHAQCSSIVIAAKNIQYQNATAVSISITDNGKGFDDEPKLSSNGLKNMHSRALKCHGKLIVRSTQQGSCIQLIIPLRL